MGSIDDGKIEAIESGKTPEELYDSLIERVRRYHPSDDISLIEKAYIAAKKAHEGQKRVSGEPYITHPISVAIILADLEMDQETIAAGLLHDVVEDTVMTNEELEEQFGSEVALLVDGVTKLQSLQKPGDYDVKDKTPIQLETQAQNLRHMFLAMAKDIRVIIIKLADRLHNMRTLVYMRPDKQRRIAQETIDIYAPLAMRLGISKIKVELDDLSLKYLEPEAFEELVRQVEEKKEQREQYVEDIVEQLSEQVKTFGIEGEVNGRVKHYFSIYKKMRNQNKTLDQIYDLFAVRIMVNDIKDCYSALGIVHEMYKPIPGRFKDYIAMPKPNMYQPLHTTLFGPDGIPFEVQIRTHDMHKAAEYGVAAHWKDEVASDGKQAEDQEEEKLTWLRQILEWQRDMSDNREFMHLLKSDLNLFADDVYCFTPTGEVKNLSAGSTPIDFAYNIHSAVGNKMVGAKVNGKIVPLDYVIQNGDQIEVITNQSSKGPSRDWLNIAKSTSTRNKINQWFRKEFKEENIAKGKEALIAYAKTKGIELSDVNKAEYRNIISKKYGFRDWDAVLAAIGHGGLKEGQIVSRLVELHEKESKQDITDEEVLAAVAVTGSAPVVSGHGNAIVVKGIHDVAVRFSKCCSPLPGDRIVGFVTRGRGVSIHRSDCVNILNISAEDKGRLIDAQWEQGANTSGDQYVADIVIFANDRKGLLVDISKLLMENGVSLSCMNSRMSRQGLVTMEVSFKVGSAYQLNSIIGKIRSVESVIDVERANSKRL